MELDAPRPKKAAAGAPAWLATFADLMSLLMCFFVLLLSFSEMDVQKYKQVAGSMAQAFGVQRQVLVEAPPMGTSFVAREFSPGKTDPTPDPIITQKAESLRAHLDVVRAAREELIKRQAERIRRGLANEIRAGKVEVETQDSKVIIRVRERASFASGSADLIPDFLPVIQRIGQVVAPERGQIAVAGHTDDVPISTGRFRSNWELSSSRATSVAHALLESTSTLNPQRVRVEGYGEFRPLRVGNTTEDRLFNRRVEISLEQSIEEVETAALKRLSESLENTSTPSPAPPPP